MVMLRKHVNNTDVAAEVVKCFFVAKKREYSVRFRWWNIVRPHAAFDLRVESRHRISVDDWEQKWIPKKFGVAPYDA